MAKSQQSQIRTKPFATGLDDPLTRAIAPPPDESEAEKAERLTREAEAKRISDDIDEEIKREKIVWKRNKSLFKLLLLGQSESGKSTTLKNFQLTFAPQAWTAERASWRAVVQLNLVRSVNIILDALADELATSTSRATSPTAPRPTTSTTSTSCDAPHHTSDSPAGSDTEVEPAEERPSSPPLQFSNKHALLKLRLAPLRHVETDLRRRLGAASSEVLSDAARASDMQATPFDDPHPRKSHSYDLCLRSNRSWREALRAEYQNVGHGRTSSVDAGDQDRPSSRPDNATEILVGCCDDIRSLWEDQVVHDMLRRRDIRLEESSGFFLNDAGRIATRAYEPTDEDVVRARLRTLGVQEYSLKFENPAAVDRSISKEWIIYDVGGSRSSRAAWLPYFEDSNAILFLAPISCFDERLAEDKRVHRLEDSFGLWKSIVQSKILAKCTIILFLNKYDLLARKLRSGVRINKYLSSFGDRENTAPVLAKYLHHKFREQHKELSPEPRSFYGFVTSVVDTKATSSTLASVRDSLVQKHLQKADFV